MKSARFAERPGSGAAASSASRGRLHSAVRRDGSQRLQKVVVFAVGTDPEPNDDIVVDDPDRAMPESDAGGVNRPCRVHALEAKAPVLWVLFETAIGFTSPSLNMLRKPSVGVAEAARGP